MQTINYFGASLHSAGHFFWKIDNGLLTQHRELSFNDIPFNPETLASAWENKARRHYPKGQRLYFQIEGWSILYYSGSCADSRLGSKTVFFVEGNLVENQMLSLVMSDPLCKRLVEGIKR